MAFLWNAGVYLWVSRCFLPLEYTNASRALSKLVFLSCSLNSIQPETNTLDPQSLGIEESQPYIHSWNKNVYESVF